MQTLLRKFSVLGLGMSLGLAALLLGPTGTSYAADPIKIGITGPMTGASARVGQDAQNGVNLAVEDARAAGELPVLVDGEKRDLSFVLVDDESSPEKGVRAVRRALSEDKVDLLLFGWHSSVGLAQIDVVAEYDKIFFGPLPATDGISNKIIEKGYTHYFKGWPAIGAMAEQYVVAVNDFNSKGLWNPSEKKAAIVIEDSDWGRGWADSIKKKLIEAGWEIVSEDVTKMDETAFGPLMTKYRAAGATLVGFTYNNPASVYAAVKAHADAGVGGLLIADGMGWFPEWNQGTGDAANFAISMDSPRALLDTQKAWQEKYKAKFNIEASPASAGHAYDYTRMLIKGLAAAGTVERKKLGETLLNLEYDGIWHRYAFSKAAGDSAIAPYEVKTGQFMKGFAFPMVQYNNGVSKVIWPEEFAETEFLAPPAQ